LGAVRHALVLPDRDRRRILLVAGARGWTLPSVSLGRDHPGSVDEVITAIRRRYRIHVSVLRTLARPRDPRTGAFNAALELERLDDRAPRARGSRWVARAALASSAVVRLRRADDREAIAAWLARGGRRAAWMHPGWRERAVRWAEARVGARATRVTQLRAWEGSSVLRLHTRRGAYYLKAVEPPCDHEPALTRWLGRRFPARVAPVVAVGARGRWLLMRAVMGPSLRSSARLSDWTRAAREYGRLQRALVGSRALPGVLGGRRRDLRWLARQIAPMLADSRGLAAGGRARLRPREIARLRRLAPELRASSRALAHLAVPLTLDHGDLWAVNVIVGRRGPAFLDWEDAVLGHPFWAVSMLPWSHGFWDRWGHRSAAAARVREAYLAGWAGREGAARYREAFELSHRLAPLHHAAIWWHDVLPHLCTSLETAALLPFFLRRALEAGRG
jgi:hypothetical protein